MAVIFSLLRSVDELRMSSTLPGGIRLRKKRDDGAEIRVTLPSVQLFPPSVEILSATAPYS